MIGAYQQHTVGERSVGSVSVTFQIGVHLIVVFINTAITVADRWTEIISIRAEPLKRDVYQQLFAPFDTFGNKFWSGPNDAKICP